MMTDLANDLVATGILPVDHEIDRQDACPTTTRNMSPNLLNECLGPIS